MMNNIEAYKVWAPDNVLWTEWVKPVIFSTRMHESIYEKDKFILNSADVRWQGFLMQDTAIVLDLPGKMGVEEAIALAHIGYRPVPLYNGVCIETAYTMILDARNLSKAIYKGAEILKGISIRPDAPPVFMLDSRRLDGFGKQAGLYDNRWCVFPQDMPSASFLLKQGIKNIIVRTTSQRSEKIQNDLSHVLCRYQEAGIKIKHTYGEEQPADITVTKPSRFKSLFYRFKAMTELSRSPAGGFGSLIPYSDSDSGHFGIG